MHKYFVIYIKEIVHDSAYMCTEKARDALPTLEDFIVLIRFIEWDPCLYCCFVSIVLLSFLSLFTTACCLHVCTHVS